MTSAKRATAALATSILLFLDFFAALPAIDPEASRMMRVLIRSASSPPPAFSPQASMMHSSMLGSLLSSSSTKSGTPSASMSLYQASTRGGASSFGVTSVVSSVAGGGWVSSCGLLQAPTEAPRARVRARGSGR